MGNPNKFIAVALAVVVLGVVLGVGAFWWHTANERRAQEDRAREVFEPARKKLEEAAAEQTYDIDKTIRVIHAIDMAVQEEEDLEAFLKQMAAIDYRGVAPDVLKARDRVLDVLMRLYARQTSIENQAATFTVTRTVLSTMSLVDVDLATAAGAPPGLDPEQAKSVLADLRRQQEERRELLDDLAQLETELIEVMVDYSETYYRHVGEWDKLVARRDRAYLASTHRNWGATIAAADSAIQLAPRETEAHLLLALAKIEQASTNPESKDLDEAIATLDALIEAHPERSAPALLLRGVAMARRGDADEATLNFEQASAYYPKQAAALTDMLDPYAVRNYLRRSQEGQRIVDVYQATMLGAGFFSPDLQLARLHFSRGEDEKGRKKILDHFSRRRNQERFELILSDIEFCEDFLGTQMDQILVEDSHLSLVVQPTLLGSKVDVGVANGSERDLFNATLFLAVRFTDMHHDDFEIFKVGETVPVVKGREETDFGTQVIDREFLGVPKGVDDIVLHRAILLTDDVVTWVDTDEHRLALARTAAATEEERAAWFTAMGTTPEALRDAVASTAQASIDFELGRDDVSVELPRELAVLNPVFRLKQGDKTHAPTVNNLESEGISLQFGDIANFEADGALQDATLEISSRHGSFEVGFDLRRKRPTSVRYLPPVARRQ